MRNLVLASVALIALFVSAPARAADTLAAPAAVQVYNWTGFYIGANAGGASGTSDAKTTTVFSPVGYFAASSVTSINANGSPTLHPGGFAGGIQAGYNWQTGNIVLGGELDFNSFHTSATKTDTVVYPCCAPTSYHLRTKVHTDWLFTARPRIGYAANNWLFYVTGGLALTRLTADFRFTDTFTAPPGALESASATSTNAGWTVGGGVEVGLWTNWSVKAEYLYTDFGKVSTGGVLTNPPGFATTNPFSHSADLKTSIGRAGINYRF